MGWAQFVLSRLQSIHLYLVHLGLDGGDEDDLDKQ